MKKHRTFHMADAIDGHVLCGCQTCHWKENVDVRGCNWVEGMERIYAARDAHEADPLADIPDLSKEDA